MQHHMQLPLPPSLEDLRNGGPIALFLDFDGTLVEIAPTPDSIMVPEWLAAGLEQLTADLDGRLALVSGRSLENLASHIGELCVAQAGSHGADCRLANGTRVGTVPKAMPPLVVDALEALAGNHHGASLETKSHGAAVHYRGHPDIEAEVVAAAEAVATKFGLAVKRGKCVVELLPESADKGRAVRALMADEAFAGSRPIFIGDDVTDEDGFAAVKEFAGLGIIVGG